MQLLMVFQDSVQIILSNHVASQCYDVQELLYEVLAAHTSAIPCQYFAPSRLSVLSH